MKLTSDEVIASVKSGKREFFDQISKRKIYLCAFDLDDSCAGYAQIFDSEGNDFEKIDLVDLSCLESC